MKRRHSIVAVLVVGVLGFARHAGAQVPAATVATCTLRLNVAPGQPSNPIDFRATLRQNCEEICRARAWSVGGNTVCEWGTTSLFTTSSPPQDPAHGQNCYAHNAVAGDQAWNVSGLGILSQRDCSTACGREADSRRNTVVCGWGATISTVNESIR